MRVASKALLAPVMLSAAPLAMSSVPPVTVPLKVLAVPDEATCSAPALAIVPPSVAWASVTLAPASTWPLAISVVLFSVRVPPATSR